MVVNKFQKQSLSHINHEVNVKKIIVILIFFFAKINLFAGGFENLGVHSRVVGLGGAYYGVGDAAYTIFYNPGGLAHIKTAELNSTYTNLFPGLQDETIYYLTFSAVANVWVVGDIGVGVTFLKSDMWQENQLIFGYGRHIYDNFTLGGSAKILRWSAAAPPGEAALSYFGLSFDVGAFYTFENLFNQGDFRIGVAAQDITKPSIAKNGHKDASLPIKLAAGISFSSRTYNYLVALDAVKEDDITFVKFGAEFLVLRSKFFDETADFIIRGGYNTIANVVKEKQNSLNGGFGITYNNFQLDYAYVYNFVMQSLGGSHKISLGYKF